MPVGKRVQPVHHVSRVIVIAFCAGRIGFRFAKDETADNGVSDFNRDRPAVAVIHSGNFQRRRSRRARVSGRKAWQILRKIRTVMTCQRATDYRIGSGEDVVINLFHLYPASQTGIHSAIVDSGNTAFEVVCIADYRIDRACRVAIRGGNRWLCYRL